MKRILLTILAILMLLTMLCFTCCQEKNEYTPTGEFYVKTLPSRGDGGVADRACKHYRADTYRTDGEVNAARGDDEGDAQSQEAHEVHVVERVHDIGLAEPAAAACGEEQVEQD